MRIRTLGRVIFRATEAKAATDLRRVIKVGDTVLDLLAGGNAGVRRVMGVLSGRQAVEQLGCIGHTHLIASVLSCQHCWRGITAAWAAGESPRRELGREQGEVA